MTDQKNTNRWSSKRIAAAALSGVIAIAGGVALTSALFTAEDSVEQSVGTATISISAKTATTSPVLAVDDLLPGDTKSTVVTVENDGTAGVYYAVSLPLVSADPALADALEVTVAVDGESATHSLSDWQDGYLQVDTELDAGKTQDITVTVTLEIGAKDALQDLVADFEVVVSAQQARNVDAPTPGWTPTKGL